MKEGNGDDAAALQKDVGGDRASENGDEVGDGEQLQGNHLAAGEKRLRVRLRELPRR